ncbi:MAG TPA: histidine kinase, partial [Puia sp.]|nr:histidine kinase [Puia sp.]
HRLNQAMKKEKEKLRLTNTVLETELRINRALMNPHFVFNSLNTLHNFILTSENDHASDYLIKFSQLIRKLLESNMQDFITLEVEIEILEQYLEIESFRFEENIQYRIVVDENLVPSTIQIPVMMLQPFVENAIWHGLLNKQGDKIIHISFSIYETAYIKCVIEDNGTGRKEHVAKAGKKSLATNFVLQRINLLNQIHNLNCSLLIEDKPNSQGTIVTILLPILNK